MMDNYYIRLDKEFRKKNIGKDIPSYETRKQEGFIDTPTLDTSSVIVIFTSSALSFLFSKFLSPTQTIRPSAASNS